MRLLLWTMCVALLAGTAGAQNRPVLRFDPNRIEFATPWAQSSPCLGDRTDPICTAQAILVCGTFSGRPECADFPRLGKFSNPQGWTRIEYRILDAGILSRAGVRRFDRESVNERFEPLSSHNYVRPGILQVWIAERVCAPEVPTCEGVEWQENIVIAERRGRRWEYVQLMMFLSAHWLVERYR